MAGVGSCCPVPGSRRNQADKGKAVGTRRYASGRAQGGIGLSGRRLHLLAGAKLRWSRRVQADRGLRLAIAHSTARAPGGTR